MNATEIKTRHGLIIQALTAKALTVAGYTYSENHQYDEISEVPDFLIPDSESPKFMVEVHQTDTRDSFRMKILRALTAVVESKIHYGDNLISVNILFGDPDREIPESNVRAMFGYFDTNLVPRYDSQAGSVMETLEQVSLELASTEGLAVVDAVQQAAEDSPDMVDALATMIKNTLDAAKPRDELKPLWQLERKQFKKIGSPPPVSSHTYHKRNILRSLFFSDTQFEELLKKEAPSDYSSSLSDQLVRCKLAECEEQIWGDELSVDQVFSEFLKTPDASNLRQLCRDRIEKNEPMKWFFEDIQNKSRRKKMVSVFLESLEKKSEQLIEDVTQNLESEVFAGIPHGRCWMGDLMCLYVGKSQNEFNRLMVQTGRDPNNYQYPFNHITGKFERLMNNPEHFDTYARAGVEIFDQFRNDPDFQKSKPLPSNNDLETKLLGLRLDGAIKLQRFNPLYEVLASIVQDLSKLSIHMLHTKSLIFDLAGGRGRLGKYDVFHISDGKKKIIAVAVAVKDQNGDHKSKEWGARRRALGYRVNDGKIVSAEFNEAIFIIDGDWEAKHVERLHRSGWSKIVRLEQVESTLRNIFGIEDESKIVIPESKDLPMAAEAQYQIGIEDTEGQKTQSKRKIK